MPETVEQNIFELLLEAGKAINSEVELEKLVQQITDIGTRITGAQFGAYFYNVLDRKGEKYLLYTVSGVPKEAFSKFPMPRNTAIFHPTFAGLGTVRYSDVTKQADYGKNSPHYGMPKGHLPVKSYLATPVFSPTTKEVIGGLFFGHPSAGVFDEKCEKLAEGIAAQAAIAMENAAIFEAKLKTEQELKEQREQYRNIFQLTTDAMIIFTSDGSVVEANIAATELLGHSADELKTLNGNDIFENSSQLFTAISSIINLGRQFKGIGKVNYAKRILSEVKIDASQFLLHGEPHILLVMKKMLGDRQIEEALLKSEAFAQTITNVSPVTLWMSNEKAEVIYVNQTWIDTVGGNSEDHLGQGWFNYVVSEDREFAKQAYRTAFDNKKVFYRDYRIKTRDGSIRWCSAIGSPYYLPDGMFGGYAGSLTDITERKQAEEQLARQNNLINTITNNTMQALFLMNDSQRCTYMNPAAELMTGFQLKDIQEKPLHYYIHHTHPDGSHFPIDDCPIDRALPTRVQTTGEETFIRKNGEFFTVAFVASPIIENGVPKGTVIEVRETGEEKRIQQVLRNKEKEAMSMLEQKVKERTAELEKTNDELVQFTSIASHDLKEPVRKVSIFSQRAKELVPGSIGKEFHHYIDNVIRSSKRMALLIDDLLALARLSQEKIPFKPVNLNRVLEHILDDLQLVILEKNAVINAGSLPTILGIELQLGQVFQNLISNSLKFAASDRRPIVNIQCITKQQNYVITYTDNGIGFDNEMAGKIFHIFERLHTKHQYEGTGIGLAIVKKIVALHGGEITARGQHNIGATFIMVLPKV